MMKKTLFLFLLLCCTQLQAQEECAVDTYNYLLAEENPSNETFQEAFSHTTLPFGVHVDQAFRLALKSKDDKWTLKVATQLAQSGIPLAYFQQFPAFTNSSLWKNFQENFPSYKKYFLENFNQELRQKVFQLREQDSLFNVAFHSFRRGEIDLTLDSMIHGATSLVDFFCEIYAEHGFPSERKTGYFYTDNKVCNSPIVIVLRHAHQNGGLLLEKELLELVCDGVISSPNYETIADYNDNPGIEKKMIYFYNKYMADRTQR